MSTRSLAIVPRPPLTPEELKRRETGVARLRERLSATPFYVEGAMRAWETEGTDERFWRDLYSSCVMA